jgi:membrane fusion protein (multidrug efflux system)
VFQLILADGSTHPHTGSLVFVDRNVDPKTGTIMLEAAFPNPETIVRPGQFARVRTAVDNKKGAVLVALRSIQENQGVTSVMVVKADDTAEVRVVKTAEHVGDLCVIETGLKAGERVMVEGMQKARPGAKVKPETVPLEELAHIDGAPAKGP